MIRYRTETFSGLGERNAAEVMAYETFEMGNADILRTLTNSLFKNRGEITDRCIAYINELEENCCVENLSFEDCIAFYKEVLEEIHIITGHEIKYVLWLADKEAVTDKEFYGRYVENEKDIVAYEIGPVVLSELGYDGTLYGYAQLPIPIEN